MMNHLQLRIIANRKHFYYGLSQKAIGASMQIKVRREHCCW